MFLSGLCKGAARRAEPGSTAFYVPHASLGAEPTTDYHERTRVFAARQIWENVGLILALGGLFALEHSTKRRATAFWSSALAALLTIVNDHD